jgi:hypothetical protein
MQIASLRLLPWMACMQKMQEHFSVAMTRVLALTPSEPTKSNQREKT